MNNVKRLLMTLIEGHANVLVKTNESGEIVDVFYQAVDTRMFETLWVGNPVDELPRIVPMICGVCSATHHVCSAKAVDGVKGVEPPETAKLIRDIMNYGLHLNNQAMHLVALGLPDFLPAEEKQRSMLMLAKTKPELVKAGVELVELGYKVVAVFGGRDIHPINAIPGGVARAPSSSDVEKLVKLFEEKRIVVESFAKAALAMLGENKAKIEKYKPGYRYMMAIDSGTPYNPTRGRVKIVDANGSTVVEFSDTGTDYLKYLDEYTIDYSYVRMVVPKNGDLRRDSIMVGALARMNILKEYGVSWADEIRDRIFEEWGKPARHPLLTHYARVAEVVALYEILLGLLKEAKFSKPLANPPARNGGEGVGIVEAPRGTLIHHYKADDNGRTTFINVITPTTINAAAIEADLRESFVGHNISEFSDKQLYADVVAIVRAYDPCMSCSTHATRGYHPFRILVVDENMRVVREVKI